MKQHETAIAVLRRRDEWRAVLEPRPDFDLRRQLRRIGEHLPVDRDVCWYRQAREWAVLVERRERLR